MRINPVSTNINRPMKNFTGQFWVEDRDTIINTAQGYKHTHVHSSYHPNLHETEEEIEKAMKDYVRTEGGNPTWGYTTTYTCERGLSLDF